MEVLEHIDNMDLLIKTSYQKLKNEGLFFGSTINKTFFSYITAIIFAEKVFRLIPQNTHQWKKFINPNKLKKQLFFEKFLNIHIQGVKYNPFLESWKYTNSDQVNYFFSCIK